MLVPEQPQALKDGSLDAPVGPDTRSQYRQVVPEQTLLKPVTSHAHGAGQESAATVPAARTAITIALILV